MSKHTQNHPIRTLALALFVTFAAFSGTVTFSGTASAEASSLAVAGNSEVAQSDGTIWVDGTVDDISDGNDDVTFLIQDPSDNDVATVSKDLSSTDFTAEIDLNRQFGDSLDAGEATIMVDEGSKFVEAEDSTTFEVDDQYPTVSIDSQFDGAENTSYPTITGSASDDTELKSVEVAISNSSGQYYDDGTSKFDSDSQVWLDTSGTSDWSYDTSSVIDDGEYDVAVRVEDEAGNLREYNGDGPPAPDSDTLSTSFTADTAEPSLSTKNIGDGTDNEVEVGEMLTITVDANDQTSGVESVEVNTSQLGGPEPLTLEPDSSGTYRGTFTVSNPSVSDETNVELDINITDAFGNSNTNNVVGTTLQTDITSVEELSFRQDFVGIVEEPNESVRVTAEGIEDAQGRDVTDGTATLEIGETMHDIDVTDGGFDTTIDPATVISDDAETGNVAVSIVEAGDGPYTDQVQLVHEVNDLDEGYQVEGTPRDASDVVFENVTNIRTYDPTQPDNPWVLPEEGQAGEGYYVYGNASDARIGYEYAETSELRSEYLHEGYNLVAATPTLNDDNDGTSIQIDDDLGSSLAEEDSGVTVYTRTNVGLDERTTSGDPFSTAQGVENISEYEGYFVEVESGEVVRVVEEGDYESGTGT